MLAVVMPVVNCVEYTQWAEQSCRPREILYLIDNGSVDGTRDWATLKAKDDPSFVYLPQGINLGVAASWNLGMRRAFADGFDRVLVTNNDVVFDLDTIVLLDRWQRETHGLVTVHARSTLDAFRLAKQHVFALPPEFCAFIITRAIVDEAGWFDEEYVQAYYEDLDYVMRLQALGIPYGCARDAVVCHYHSRTIAEGGVKAYPHQERNRQRFIRIWGYDLPWGERV